MAQHRYGAGIVPGWNQPCCHCQPPRNRSCLLPPDTSCFAEWLDPDLLVCPSTTTGDRAGFLCKSHRATLVQVCTMMYGITSAFGVGVWGEVAKTGP